MEKYGVSQEQIDELVKLGIAKGPAEARRIVGSGEAEGKIKEARAKGTADLASLAAYHAAGATTGRTQTAELTLSNPPRKHEEE